MDYWCLISAAAISLFGAIFHGIIGGKIYMANINNSNMEPLTKSLSLVSWHIFTIFLCVGAIALSIAAYIPAFTPVAYPIVAVNLLGSILFVFLGLSGHKMLIKMPGAYLMAGTALFAGLGVW
jgi:glucan phosphoethanolaminetransferase (alkaline phosphatase superfamily)